MRRRVIISALACTILLIDVGLAQRVAPPSPLTCDRNHLTSFTGRVIRYRRANDRIVIRVRTDEETTENFTIRLARADDGSKHFLMRGQEFKAPDWKIVEASRTRLQPKMRAIVWVCDDGSAPVIDWRPFEP